MQVLGACAAVIFHFKVGGLVPWKGETGQPLAWKEDPVQ